MTQQHAPTSQIHPAPDNLRTHMGSLDELRASIQASGILEPLVVTQRSDNSGGYDLVSGHRRLAAAKQAGLEQVPIVITDLDDDQRTEAILVENLQREDLTPIDEARGYARLVARDYTTSRLAQRIGRSQKHVAARLSLLDLPQEVRDLVNRGEVSITAALTAKDALAPDSDIEDRQREQLMGLLRSGRDPSFYVRQLDAVRQRRHALSEAAQRCEDKNIPYQVREGYEMPDGVMPIGDDHDAVDIPEDRLEGRPYYGVLIEMVGGQQRARKAILDMRRFRDDMRREAVEGGAEIPEALRAIDEAGEERKRQRREERERKQRHRSHAAHAVASIPRDALARRLLVDFALAQIRRTEAREVAATLGLEPDVHQVEAFSHDGEPTSRRERDWLSPIARYAAESEACAERAALAAALTLTAFSEASDLSGSRQAVLDAFPPPEEGQ